MSSYVVALRNLAVFWLTAIVVQIIARLLFYWSYAPNGLLKKAGPGHILEVMSWGIRMDVSFASFLVWTGMAFALCFFFISADWLHKLLKFWLGGMALILTLLIATRHFYYLYYRDTFNHFFWEFWLDWENSKLVIFSILDELPVFSIVIFLLGFAVVWVVITRKLFAFLAPYWKNIESLWLLPIWIILLIIGTRATFDRLPLAMQPFRGNASKFTFLTQTHSNGAYDLLQSWKEDFTSAYNFKKNYQNKSFKNDVRTLFQEAARTLGDHEVEGKNSADLKLIYNVPALQEIYLKRPPDQVVVLFMESFFSWPGESSDLAFADTVQPNFRKLKEEGILFENYFQAGAGTIGNIAKANLGIATPVYAPEEITFPEAFHSFPGSLPNLMNAQGYIPYFYYGGSLAWHNLANFMPKIGYKEVFSEADFPDIQKNRFGLHDQDLFKMLHQKLSSASKPSFHFVMTLSNHPPYQVPDSFQSPVQAVPKELLPYMKDKEAFDKRFRAFAYSDMALGEFFKRAKKSPYFKNTLFVITADHSVKFPFFWPEKWDHHYKRIPLLFYAPDLLKTPPEKKKIYGTHYDLAPTLLSILSKTPQKITHWGSSLFVAKENRPLLSYYLDCWKSTCVNNRTQHSFARKKEEKLLQDCSDNQCKTKDLKKLSESYRNSGIYYLLNFQN